MTPDPGTSGPAQAAPRSCRHRRKSAERRIGEGSEILAIGDHPLRIDVDHGGGSFPHEGAKESLISPAVAGTASSAAAGHRAMNGNGSGNHP